MSFYRGLGQYNVYPEWADARVVLERETVARIHDTCLSGQARRRGLHGGGEGDRVPHAPAGGAPRGPLPAPGAGVLGHPPPRARRLPAARRAEGRPAETRWRRAPRSRGGARRPRPLGDATPTFSIPTDDTFSLFPFRQAAGTRERQPGYRLRRAYRRSVE